VSAESQSHGTERPDRAGDEESGAVAVFAALSDPVRRALLTSLAQQGPATVTDLAARLPITRQAVAKHLTHLVEAGLIRAQAPEGRRVCYRVDPALMRQAMHWLAVLANAWDDRLDALARHLETRPTDAAGP
jgi:DNA-binding transcriptional ArsR family regulator